MELSVDTTCGTTLGRQWCRWCYIHKLQKYLVTMLHTVHCISQ